MRYYKAIYDENEWYSASDIDKALVEKDKQIAELQEKLERTSRLHIEALAKISRRNLQIGNQKIEIKNLKAELWNTANELAAVKIQIRCAMIDFSKLSAKLYVASPYTLATPEDDAYRNGVDSVIEALE